jgi:hypothetical protein
MKTRLLKRLRREAKKEVYIYTLGLYGKKEYHIYGYNVYDNPEEAKMELSNCRRNYILSIIKQIRLNGENKQLRKL